MTETYILNITGLGRLEIVETYEYYDQPVLFSCKSDDQTQPRMEPIQPDYISEDMLPVPGECLDLEIETFPMLSDAEEIAKSRNQEIL